MKSTVPLSRFFLTTLVLTLVAGCNRGGPPQGGPPPGVPVRLAVVESATIDQSTEYLARLESRRSVELKPQVEGRISQILVKSGDPVAAGAWLIQIDPAQQQATVSSQAAAVETQRAELENARATLKSLEAERLSAVSELRLSQQEYQRYATLYRQGAESRQNLEQFTSRLQTARANLGAVEARMRAQQATIARAAGQVQQAQANVKQQQVELQYYRITAPFGGTVGDIPVKVGDFVNDSTMLTRVTQNQPLEVNIDIPIEQAPDLRQGMTVQLKDAQGNIIGDSRIFSIAPSVKDDSQSVQIKSLFDNSKNQLRADQNVRAEVIWDKRPGVLIPTTAVSRLAGQNFVFVAQTAPPQGQPQQGQPQAQPQGQPKLVAKQKPVKLGNIQGNNYQVLEGLKPGETIIVSGLLNLTDGVPIIPESQQSKQSAKGEG